MKHKSDYVHGYSDGEAGRLLDQANAVRDFLHYDTIFPEGSHILEAGCGVGAQTVTLSKQNPNTLITSIDISEESLEKARELAGKAGLTNVQFRQADIFALPFPEARFDHIFVCYVLEHLKEPVAALKALARVLKPNGSITVIEGDHGSCYFHPETPEAVLAWNCLIRVQADLGGDSLIGRRLYPVLCGAGFQAVHVSPRMIYIDQSKPRLMDAFTIKTITAMVEGVKEMALASRLLDESTWAKGIEDLRRIAKSPEGTFCYTFFKAVGTRAA
jgi:hypothetical protein